MRQREKKKPTAIFLTERVHLEIGLKGAAALILLGVCSVLYWRHTETMGCGDLRFYIWVQFFPIVVLPLLLLYFPARYTKQHYLWWALLWSCLARLCERGDGQIFSFLQEMISGHTLKHIFMSIGVYCILQYVLYRAVAPFMHEYSKETCWQN